ncbi:MAG: SRPBCC family protein [Chloroflexi bacterium]|nr:SRPBCC family protein [Chloroflexota bacterium]
MLRIHKSIRINAPVTRVFAFLNDPRNLPDIWTSMIEVRDVTPAKLGGYNFGWVYKMAGMKFEGTSEITEYVPNQRNATKSIKGIESRFVWTYKSVENDTDLILDIEYTVPIPLLGKIAETLIMKQNDREGDALLENLKTKMEHEVPIHA